MNCQIEDCEKPSRCRGWCWAHYQRWVRHGDPLGSKPREHWPSAGWISGDYRYTVVEGKPMLEHRHIMQQKLGRKLLPGENVHHKNGNRVDNRPENLELWVTCQPSGQRPEDLVEYAVELLRRYSPERLTDANSL